MNERKRALRTELAAVRARLSPDDRAARSLGIAARILELPGFAEARVLALYARLGAEVDPTEIARAAAARGAVVLFPRVPRDGRRLSFAAASPEALVRGPLGTLEPPRGAREVPLAEIPYVVVPCLAFSPDGLRLGRGGGYYDATLPAMSGAIRVGVAFEVQRVPELPCEPHDARLDALVTEDRVLLFQRGAPSPASSAP